MNFCFSSRCFSHFSRGLQLAALILLGLCALSPQAGGLRNPRFLVFSPAPTAHTFVSHSGADVAPCSRNAPCATFQFALTQTLPGGTVTAINAGEYGPMTITQAVTVDGEGTQAGITVTTGNGITINAGPTDAVVLRGLTLNGAGGGPNVIGVSFLSGGSLVLDHSAFSGFGGFGLDLEPGGTSVVSVLQTTFTGCATGVRVAGNSGQGPARVSLRDVTIQGGRNGVFSSSGATDLKDSLITQNSQFGLVANGGTLSVSGCTLTGNGVAAVDVVSDATIRLTNNDIWNNEMAMINHGTAYNAIVSTTGNNRRAGNAGTATPFAPSDQPNRSIAVQ